MLQSLVSTAATVTPTTAAASASPFLLAANSSQALPRWTRFNRAESRLLISRMYTLYIVTASIPIRATQPSGRMRSCLSVRSHKWPSVRIPFLRLRMIYSKRAEGAACDKATTRAGTHHSTTASSSAVQMYPSSPGNTTRATQGAAVQTIVLHGECVMC